MHQTQGVSQQSDDLARNQEAAGAIPATLTNLRMHMV